VAEDEPSTAPERPRARGDRGGSDTASPAEPATAPGGAPVDEPGTVTDFSPSTPAPFPTAWPRLASEDLPHLKRSARALPRSVDALVDRAAALLGVAPKHLGDALYPCAPEQLAGALGDPLAAVVLRAAEGRILVELDLALAGAVVDRVLGGEGAAGVARLDDLQRGVLLFAAAHLTEGLPWVAQAVVTTPLAFAAALGDRGASVWSHEVRLGELHGVVRVWVPAATSLRPRPASLPALGLEMVAHAGETTLEAEDLRGLRAGDVVLLDEVFTPGVRVRARGARRLTIHCDAELRVLRHELVLSPPVGEGGKEAMSNEAPDDAAIGDPREAFGDAPVELSVEVARFRMTLAELAEVRPGEVLRAGVEVGTRVVLRAGDEVVAEGELVDVEGQTGVRIHRLAT